MPYRIVPIKASPAPVVSSIASCNHSVGTAHDWGVDTKMTDTGTRRCVV